MTRYRRRRKIRRIHGSTRRRRPAGPPQRSHAEAVPQAEVSVLQRALVDPTMVSPAEMLTLQRSVGNRAVSGLIQAHTTVGPVGDRYEREAEQVSEQVLNTQPAAASGPRSVQRQGSERDELAQREPWVTSITPLVQGLGSDGRGAYGASPELERRLVARQGAGRPLPEATRATMEPRFGADFSDVRLHTDAEAGRLTRKLQAKAFTHGRDIYLGAGQYRPETTSGKRLLAHELTHSIQQTGGARAVQGATLIQRDLDPKAGRALDKAIQAGGGGIYTLVKDHLQKPECRLSPKSQRNIIHLWSKWEKKREKRKGRQMGQGKEQELEDRLDYVRAFLLAQYATEFNDSMRAGDSRKVARKKALSEVGSLKKKLRSFGLAKAGQISPELNYLLKEEAAMYTGIGKEAPIVGAATEVDVGPRIEIRGTSIPGSKLPGKWHSFIVYTDETGKQSYIAAHSYNGILQAAIADYTPAADPEWDPGADSVTLEEGGDRTAAKWDRLQSAAQAINAQNIRYSLLKRNCNRAAYHILKAAGVDGVKPPGTGYPGWGKMLFETTEEEEEL